MLGQLYVVHNFFIHTLDFDAAGSATEVEDHKLEEILIKVCFKAYSLMLCFKINSLELIGVNFLSCWGYYMPLTEVVANWVIMVAMITITHC